MSTQRSTLMNRHRVVWPWLRETAEALGVRAEARMYKDGRPTRLGALLNRGWALAGRAGMWQTRLVTLEVRGHRSGRVRAFPLVVAHYRGERYLVAMLGERARWVANVRAARGSFATAAR
jgi:hypothetical protein